MELIVVIAVVLLLVAALVWLSRDVLAPKIVHPWEAGLLYVNGRYEGTLEAGRYWPWRGLDKVEVNKLRVKDQWLTDEAGHREECPGGHGGGRGGGLKGLRRRERP